VQSTGPSLDKSGRSSRRAASRPDSDGGRRGGTESFLGHRSAGRSRQDTHRPGEGPAGWRSVSAERMRPGSPADVNGSILWLKCTGRHQDSRKTDNRRRARSCCHCWSGTAYRRCRRQSWMRTQSAVLQRPVNTTAQWCVRTCA
jgi:hypothetical protein